MTTVQIYVTPPGVLKGFHKLEGSIHINVPTKQNFTNITLNLYGRAGVNVVKPAAPKDSSKLPDFAAVDLFDKTLTLAEKKKKDEIATLDSGKHVYDFSFDLDAPLLPSLNHRGLNVRYVLTASINTPSRALTRKTRVALHSMGTFAPEHYLDDGTAASNNNAVRAKGFLLSKGECTLKVSAVAAAKHEQTINVMVEVDNQTGKKINSLTVKLVQTHRALIGAPVRVKRRFNRTTFDGTSVDKKTNKTHVVKFPIPARAAPSFEIPGLMSLSYNLHIQTDVTAAANLRVKLPIVITTRSYKDKDALKALKKERSGREPTIVTGEGESPLDRDLAEWESNVTNDDAEQLALGGAAEFHKKPIAASEKSKHDVKTLLKCATTLPESWTRTGSVAPAYNVTSPRGKKSGDDDDDDGDVIDSSHDCHMPGCLKQFGSAKLLTAHIKSEH